MPFNFGAAIFSYPVCEVGYQGGEIEWLISEYCRSMEEESAEF